MEVGKWVARVSRAHKARIKKQRIILKLAAKRTKKGRERERERIKSIQVWHEDGASLQCKSPSCIVFIFMPLVQDKSLNQKELQVASKIANMNNQSLPTLNMLFSVTYCLEFHNTIIVYCTSHFNQSTKVELVVWTLQNIDIFTW